MSLPAWSKKMPRRVTICGKPYKVGYNMRGGACFNVQTYKITVGCIGTREEAHEMLIHEISECVHVELGHRYFNGESGHYAFVLDHAAFQRHNLLMVAVLRDCGLLR